MDKFANGIATKYVSEIWFIKVNKYFTWHCFSAPRLETSIIFIDGKAVASGGKTILSDVGDGIDGSAK